MWLSDDVALHCCQSWFRFCSHKGWPCFFSQSSKCQHPRWATAGPAQRSEWAASCHKVLSVGTWPYSISQHYATDIRHLWHPVSRQLIPTEHTSLESLIWTFILEKNEIIFKTAGCCEFLFNSGAGGGDDWKGTAVALCNKGTCHSVQNVTGVLCTCSQVKAVSQNLYC